MPSSSVSLCLSHILLAHRFPPLDSILGSVVAKLTRNSVISWPGGLLVQVDGASVGTAKTSGQTVLGAGETVPSLGGDVLMGSHVVGARSRQFILCGFAPSQHLSEVPHAAVLVLGGEVLSVLVDGEGSRVLSWSRHSHFFLVLVLNFGGEGVVDV